MSKPITIRTVSLTSLEQLSKALASCPKGYLIDVYLSTGGNTSLPAGVEGFEDATSRPVGELIMALKRFDQPVAASNSQTPA